MAVGVAISGVMAFVTMNSPLAVIYTNQWYFYGVVAIELILVLGIQFAIKRISPGQAFMLYLVYAALNGITIAGLLSIYLAQSVVTVVAVFAAAVVMFASLALYGYRTTKDYSGWGSFLFAGVIGIIVASLINIFFKNDIFSIVISAIALLVFAALTVYDNQFYKNLHSQIKDSPEELSRYATLGALHMYINFIVMFQSLLQLVGFARD